MYTTMTTEFNSLLQLVIILQNVASNSIFSLRNSIFVLEPLLMFSVYS